MGSTPLTARLLPACLGMALLWRAAVPDLLRCEDAACVAAPDVHVSTTAWPTETACTRALLARIDDALTQCHEDAHASCLRAAASLARARCVPDPGP
jgi:hypothetical protein